MDAVDWVNAAFAAVLLASLLVGVLRGLVFEVLSLLVWAVAWVVAHAFADDMAAAAFWPAMAPTLRHGLAWVLVFVLTLMAGRLVVWSIRQLLHLSPLAGLDRFLGGLFGLVRGGLIALIVVMLVGESPLAQREPWRQALAVQWSQQVLARLLPWMPGQWSVGGASAPSA
jgi:membrane protein required for colicin V production